MTHGSALIVQGCAALDSTEPEEAPWHGDVAPWRSMRA